MTTPEASTHSQNDQSRVTELWSFALCCYSVEQAALLGLQESVRLHINDALFAAYARAHHLTPDAARWQQIRAGRPRQLLLRVRQLRYRLSRSDPNRKRALEWELELERWDLARLAGCLGGDNDECSDDARVAGLLSQQCDLSVYEAIDLLERLVRSGKRAKQTGDGQ